MPCPTFVRPPPGVAAPDGVDPSQREGWLPIDLPRGVIAPMFLEQRSRSLSRRSATPLVVAERARRRADVLERAAQDPYYRMAQLLSAPDPSPGTREAE